VKAQLLQLSNYGALGVPAGGSTLFKQWLTALAGETAGFSPPFPAVGA